MESIPGITVGSNVKLNDSMRVFLSRLRSEVPSSIPIHITSGYRDATSQAGAIYTKLIQGDDIAKLYRNSPIVREILSSDRSKNSIEAIISKYENQGLYMSRHMRGDALDIRKTNLSESQIQEILAGARRAGAKNAFVESIPPHIHVDGFATWQDQAIAIGTSYAEVVTPMIILFCAAAGILIYRAKNRRGNGEEIE